MGMRGVVSLHLYTAYTPVLWFCEAGVLVTGTSNLDVSGSVVARITVLSTPPLVCGIISGIPGVYGYLHSRSTAVTIFLVCAHRKLAEVVHVEVFLLSVGTSEGTLPKKAETLRPRSIN